MDRLNQIQTEKITFTPTTTPTPTNKAAAISQTTSNAFSWMEMLEFRKEMSLKFVTMGLIENEWALVQVMAIRRQAIIWTNADPCMRR